MSVVLAWSYGLGVQVDELAAGLAPLLVEAGFHLSCTSFVNMSMRACCWQVRAMVRPPTVERGLLCSCCCAGLHCNLLVERTSVDTVWRSAFGSNSGEIRNAAEEAPRRSAAGGGRQCEFLGSLVGGSLFLCRSGCQKLPKRRGRVCCAGFETGS